MICNNFSFYISVSTPVVATSPAVMDAAPAEAAPRIAAMSDRQFGNFWADLVADFEQPAADVPSGTGMWEYVPEPAESSVPGKVVQ